MRENQASITKWADGAFGPLASTSRSLARANEELAQLTSELCGVVISAKAAERAGDVYICLYRAASAIGFDLRIAEQGAPMHALGVDASPTRLAALATRQVVDAIAAIEADPIHRFSATALLGLAAHFCREIAGHAGADIDDVIDAKMQRNRRREWLRDGTGCGYRVDPLPSTNAIFSLDAAAAAIAEEMGIAWEELPDAPETWPEWCMGSALHPAKATYRNLAARAFQAAGMESGKDGPLVCFNYTGKDGITARRVVRLLGLRYGRNEYHDQPGYLLRAFDLDREAEREFSFSGISPATEDA